MASIYEKIRIATLSNFHAFLDAVIDLDSVGAVKQHARDLEAAIRQMQEFGNSLIGSISTLKRDITNGTSAAEELQLDIDALLLDDVKSNDKHALTIQVTLDETNRVLEDNRAKLTEKEAQSEQVETAIARMTAKLNQMLRRIVELDNLEEEAKALESGADAVANMERIMGDLPSVDQVGERIREKHATAQAGFDRVLGSATAAMDDDVTVASAEAAIARRREELKVKSTKKTSKVAAG